MRIGQLAGSLALDPVLDTTVAAAALELAWLSADPPALPSLVRRIELKLEEAGVELSE